VEERKVTSQSEQLRDRTKAFALRIVRLSTEAQSPWKTALAGRDFCGSELPGSMPVKIERRVCVETGHRG